MKNIIYKEFSHYLVDENGNVYNTLCQRGVLKNGPKKIKSFPNKKTGYLQIILQNKKEGVKPKLFYVHRLVATSYIENPNNLPEVNHKDLNKTNNHISNLEWVTRKENLNHRNENYKTTQKLYLLLKNKDLLNKGIEHYNEYKDIEYLKKLWNYSVPRRILKILNIKYYPVSMPNNKLFKLLTFIKNNPDIDTNPKILNKVRSDIGYNFRYDTFKLLQKNYKMYNMEDFQ